MGILNPKRSLFGVSKIMTPNSYSWSKQRKSKCKTKITMYE